MSTTNQQGSTASQNGNQPIAQQLAVLKAKRQQLPIQQNKRSRFAWTGFSGKTLWDWLQLLATLAIPLVVTGASIGFGFLQYQLSDQQHQNDQLLTDKQHKSDQQLADDQQQEAALKNYIDDMSTLLLTYKLRVSQPSDEVRQVARAKTITVLRKLNSNRKGSLVQFLYESQLIDNKNPIVLLNDADLQGANLSNVHLRGASLRGANLYKADFRGADLYYIDLSYATLRGAYLNALLHGANLQHAHLENANLWNASLSNANLRYAILGSADLHDTYLGNADLRDTYLDEANLRNANLEDANLAGAFLEGADLRDANLTGADLTGADLTGADLTGANLSGIKR